MRMDRRRFGGMLVGAAGAAAVGWGQSTARPNVGAVDHNRMVGLGKAALGETAAPITTIAAKASPGSPHDYFSDATFIGHKEALRLMCVQVGALAGAYGVSKDEAFAAAGVERLRAWLVSPATRMTPDLRLARVVGAQKEGPSGTPEGIFEGVYLAEVAMGVPFLAASEAMTDADLAGIKAWFGAYVKWLTELEDAGPRIAALARDMHNHHASSWMLQAGAMARLTGNDAVLAECRHRFERVLLRAQMVALGNFPAELTTPSPYRNSLLNLDLMGGVCEVLSTPFESVWDYELADGPGMRAAIAYHFPYIQRRSAWPFPADASHFSELPLRRPALVMAARAYTRPEYADVWKTLPADPEDAPGGDHLVAESFPIRQPYLWMTRPPRRVVG
jgi:hypothetical protein